MPTYGYICPDCGPFERFRPMAESAEPSDCPACGSTAPRVILTAPRMAMMDAGTRKAHATNEKAAHSPDFSTKASRAGGGHGPGCSCCSSSKKPSRAVHTPDGGKTFPSARPWMISH